MNPMMESLLGMKAFNDQFIAEDLLQDNLLRLQMLAQCLESANSRELIHELLPQLTASIQLEQRLLQLCLDKDWLHQDAAEQFSRDVKWAHKALAMLPE
ncbi:hypothetical protein [Paenibacillus azoreducens]|uniref:Spore coat protein n=1 Tax=Paenibacillus azoreducens TaxID=116718 RepID=A0A919YHP3_9BACL|nr:hypothetical protein [Paenibacillus azoreducens]GIO49808.1 hypothetical protein J34TS1_45730 [Paenibacillus azoreducens]